MILCLKKGMRLPDGASPTMEITAFAIAAGQNTGGHNDATGAFLPAAKRFGQAYRCPWKQFDNIGDTGTVRKRFLNTIETHCPGGTNFFAYFGHGISGGMASAHIYEKQLDDFLSLLKPKLATQSVVVLYACSSGKEGGFTGKLRNQLGSDTWVYGHSSVGHTFRNPDVTEEATNNSPTFRMLYPLGSALRSPWAEALSYTDLWLRFPWLTDEAIDAEVNARRLLGKWEVTISGKPARHYLFDSVYETWTMDSGRDIDDTPHGTVKAFAPSDPSKAVDTGLWELGTGLGMDWDSGANESWQLPLSTVGQQGSADGVPLSARRLSHPATHGKIQG
jgi:hypothetical protein